MRPRPLFLVYSHCTTSACTPSKFSVHFPAMSGAGTDLSLFAFSMSQPGCSKDPVDESVTCGHSLPWFQVKQRAYLSFLIPRGSPDGGCECEWECMKTSSIDRFFDTLKTDDRIYISIISFDGTCKIETCTKNYKNTHNFPDEWFSNILQEVRSKSLWPSVPYLLTTYRPSRKSRCRPPPSTTVRCSTSIVSAS